MANGTGLKAIIASAERASSSARQPTYSSPLIKARRHRILIEVQRLIGEVGIANLSMDEVASHAAVSKRTLYNAFQSKEGMIAAAIHQYFEDFASSADCSTPPETLDRMVERLLREGHHSLKARNYTRALMTIYHGHDIDPAIRNAIYAVSLERHGPCIRRAAANRQLQPWIKPDELIRALVTLRFGLINAWSLGLIEDRPFLSELVSGSLTLLAGATRGVARNDIEHCLAELPNHPLLSLKDQN